MPLYTRHSQASTTSYLSPTADILSNRHTNRSNLSNLRSFRVLPSYPSPQHRREIQSDASSSSFRTSYILVDDSDIESDDSTATDLSREFLKRKLLQKGNFMLDDDSSDDSESFASEMNVERTYTLPAPVRPIPKLEKSAFHFNSEGTGPVSFISPIRAGQAWICRNNDKLIHMYNKNGHKKNTRTLNTRLSSMCQRKDGTVLVICYLSQSISKMSSSGRLTDFISFELAPGGICCTSRNETLVTTMPVRKSRKVGPRARQCPSILRLTLTGEKIWEIKYKGTDRFVNPTRIAVNINGDICVIDEEPSREQVVIFSPDGEERRRYYGVHNKVLPHPFNPKDICCDRNGNIYVADLHSCAVHVLDKQGHFSHFLVTNNDVSAHPSAIACDYDGFVWVGFSSGLIRVYDVDKMGSTTKK